MNVQMRNDYYRMTGKEYRFGVRSVLDFILKHQIRYMFWWRKANKKKNPLYRVILYKYSRKYGLEISTSAEIGQGLYLGHPYNITVGAGVKIGDNVNLHKGCTIGRENRGKRLGTPTIGDNVYVGINATIVGNVQIGDDVMIAPGSFVNFDVPEHSIVLGNPGNIYKKENATMGYVAHQIKEMS